MSSNASSSTDDEQVAIDPYSPNSGVSRRGWESPGFDDIRATRIAQLEVLTGKDLTGTTSVEVQFAEAMATVEALQWQVWESLYYAAYYPFAKGLNLDYVLAISGVDRRPRIESGGEVTFTASNPAGAQRDITIPQGTKVATNPDPETDDPEIVFRTEEPVVLREGREKVRRVPIRALGPLDRPEDIPDDAFGAGTNVAPGTITRILDPVSGIGDSTGETDGVTNPIGTGQGGERPVLNPDGSESETIEIYSFRTGRDRETDPEYRRRYERILSTAGAATLEAVRAAIISAGDGSVVLDARVEENTTNDDWRPEGGPAKSMSPYVRFAKGRDDAAGQQDVAQAILDTRSGGMECYGPINPRAELPNDEGGSDPYPPPDLDDRLTDPQGDYRGGLGFAEIRDAEIYIAADVVVNEQFPGTGEAEIAASILEYLGDAASTTGTSPGEDVFVDKIAGKITESTDGVNYIDGEPRVGIGSAPASPGDERLEIASDQIAIGDADWISLNVNVQTEQN